MGLSKKERKEIGKEFDLLIKLTGKYTEDILSGMEMSRMKRIRSRLISLKTLLYKEFKDTMTGKLDKRLRRKSK